MTEKENNIPEAEMEVTVEKQEKSEVKDDSQKKRWYVVHTYSGHENKVKVNLEKRIEYMNMGEKIFRVEVPQKTITQVKGGKKTEKEDSNDSASFFSAQNTIVSSPSLKLLFFALIR